MNDLTKNIKNTEDYKLDEILHGITELERIIDLPEEFQNILRDVSQRIVNEVELRDTENF